MIRFSALRALVLGAAGFIGRWVARALCAEGVRPYLLVRDRARAERVLAGVSAEWVERELVTADDVLAAVRAVRPTVTFNLIGYGVDREGHSAALARFINGELVEHLCRALAAARGPAWGGLDLVHVGSAAEYGTLGGDLREDAVPTPTTLYGQSKLVGTQALYEGARRLGLRAVSARLFTVYGPGERPGRLLPTLTAAAGTERPIPLTAGTQRRDFTYVEDVADCLLRLARAREAAGIVNVATGRLTSVRDFAATVARALGIDASRLAFGALPTRSDEMNHDEVNIERLKKFIGTAPATPLEQGILRTIFHDDEPSAPAVEQVRRT